MIFVKLKAICGIFIHPRPRTKLMNRRSLKMASSGVAFVSRPEKRQDYSEGRIMTNSIFPPKVTNLNFPVMANVHQSITFDKQPSSKAGFTKEIDKLIAEYQRNPESYREVIHLLKCAKECETRTEESKEMECTRNLVDCTTASEYCLQDNVLRGVLIVFEGADCSGKSTQSSRLEKDLKSRSHKVRLMRFPDRSTSIGQVISAYLEKKLEMNDRTIHLLFSANRWEFVQQMRKDLAAGVTLVLDRYAFSGVAYSARKPGLSLSWCQAPERGLPCPDLVVLLETPPGLPGQTRRFGCERYETSVAQSNASSCLKKLADDPTVHWEIIGTGSEDEVHQQILATVEPVLLNAPNSPLGRLWNKQD
uniref:thymidylate kinase isoform X2 n=1 Tax=Myxine glutinosa TaxID=7769 RepID=UPI00358EFBB5